MDWFWGDKKDKDDPYKKLDSGLKDFLDKESTSQKENTKPVSEPPQQPQPQVAPSTTPQSTQPNVPSTNYRAQLGIDVPGLSQDNQNAPERTNRPAVPAESLFQDGRYAHLWKNYRPRSEIEAASRTDQDRLADVAEAYKDRKAAIGRAALENCVEEQLAEQDCYRHGGLRQTMTMCRTEAKAFNRCYTMQARFLKALGYLSIEHRSVDEEEKIQMHADKLYHEMLERERIQEEARRAGEEEPAFRPLIEHENIRKALGDDSAWSRARQKAQELNLPTSLSQYSPERQKEIHERIKDMPATQKELELQLIAAEERAKLEYAEQASEGLAEERRLRAERRAKGKETVGDTIKRLWGWDKER